MDDLIVRVPFDRDTYPVGHPCHGLPLHTHPTQAQTDRCELWRRKPHLIPPPSPQVRMF